MRLPRIWIHRQKAGVISDCDVWCCWLGHGMTWLYVDDSLLRLIWTVITEWKHDRHLVG
jgi:hypothetical protein